MSRLQILSAEEKRRYETPPRIIAKDRLLVFSIPEALQSVVNSLRSLEAKVGFIIQLGYFQVSGRFYPINEFRTPDITFVARSLGAGASKVRFSEAVYSRRVAAHHRGLILKALGWNPYHGTHRDKIEVYAQWCARLQIKPEEILSRLIQSCWENHIELPGYHTFEILITRVLGSFEKDIVRKLASAMGEKEFQLVDRLLAKGKTEADHEATPDIEKLLVALQNAPHSSSPHGIKESVRQYEWLLSCRATCIPTLEAVGLSDSAIRYFAEWVRKAPLHQLQQIKEREKVLLHVSCYVFDEIKLRSDMLVDILLKVVHRLKATVDARLKDEDVKKRLERDKELRLITKSHVSSVQALNKVRDTASRKGLSDRQKVEKITEITEAYFSKKTNATETYLKEVERKINREVRERFVFVILSELETKLSLRVKRIVLALHFDFAYCDKTLADAVIDFQEAQGAVSETSPVAFLSETEREAVLSEKKFNPALYRVLLYRHLAQAIKAGKISVPDSNNYRSLDALLIPQEQWSQEKETLLDAAGLGRFKDVEAVLQNHKDTLSLKYKEVNERIQSGENKDIRKTAKGLNTVVTPRLERQGNRFIANLLADTHIPVFEVLQHIDHTTQFSGYLKHFAQKRIKSRPSQVSKLAAVLASGCNIHPGRLVKISKGISESSLLNTTNWYLSPENLDAANRVILDATSRLPLSKIYQAKAAEQHTASDGRKVGVSLESLQARYSFKYYGRGKGVSVYSYIDAKQQTFHINIIDPSRREASYVVEGLVGNIGKNAVHSTDTHGFSEAVFAIMDLLGIYFAPRFARLGGQSMYTLSASEYPCTNEYRLQPKGVISGRKIVEQWDEVLRFVATIALERCSASRLFNRLNSYSSDHPLYRAFKEYGRIIKSLYILDYFDDRTMRQNVQWMLNTSEGANKFGRAVSFDNGGQFLVRSWEQQLVAAKSQSLIQNAIVLWNYMYVSQFLLEKSTEERMAALEMLRDSSVMTWGHVNLRGEYDFTEKTSEVFRFQLNELEELQIE